jgi:DNA replication protein DnaC
MMRSDFLAVDELGKEHYKTDSYLMVQLESILKDRYDNGQPTLLASNLEYEVLSDLYGPTISSMLEGRFTQVRLEGGDYRLKTARRMARDMDF